MIQFSIDLINSKSPYEVYYAPNGDFGFATVENKGFYAAIIVENRNPLLKNIIEDFETTAQALTEGKP